MSNHTWFQINKKPSQYEGIKGDIQPPLLDLGKQKGQPLVRPFNKYAPAPVGKIPSPLFFRRQKIEQENKQNYRRYKYLAIMLFVSIIFSGSSLIFQWGNNSFKTVSANANEGQNRLLSAKQALEKRDLNLAVSEFVKAEESFREAKNTVAFAKNLLVENPLRSAYYIFESGELIALAGEQTCVGIAPVLDLIFSKEGDKGLDLTTGRFLKEIMIAFSLAEGPFKQAVANIEQAQQNLQKIAVSQLNPDIQENIASLQEKLPAILTLLNQGYQLSQFLPSLLGNNTEKKYLILFQNSWELRPTGGFIGGFSTLVVKDAQIKELYTKNVYDIDGQIRDYVEPPKPLDVAWPGVNWSMRDANWDPDFPSSAAQIEWFYNKAVNDPVDGLIAITPTFIYYILKVLGPVAVNYNNQQIIVTADNFVLVNEEQERNTPSGTDPRKFLINLTSEVFNKLLAVPKEKWATLLAAVKAGLEEKHLLFNFHNHKAQGFAEKHNWAGKIIPTNKNSDYVQVVDANINGSKSSQLVKQEINLNSAISSDGKIQNKLTIIYQHTGTNIWPSSQVNYYTRTYVPAGSKLISATGNKTALTEVFLAHEKTVFADYLQIKPGDTVSLVYVYELPFSLSSDNLVSYQLYVQKQSGTTDRQLRFSMQLPPQYKAISSPRKIEITSGNEVWFLDSLNTDQHFEVLLKKQ